MTSISTLSWYGDNTTVSSATTSLVTFTAPHTPSESDEKKILIALSNQTPDNMGFNTSNSLSNEDITAVVFRDVMVANELTESNTIMTLMFTNDTPVTTDKHDADVVYHNAGNDITDPLTSSFLNLVTPGVSLVSSVKTNTMELGSNTAPLYVGHLKFEFTNGDSEYTSVAGGHHIEFDTADPDYNFHKAINSTLMNLDSGATNGIQGGFDNTFNSIDAFYTESIISRDAVTNQLTATNSSTLGFDGISSSNGIANDPLYNALTVEVLPQTSDNVPLFGSLKFVQDLGEISFPDSNNTTTTSSMSILAFNAELSAVPIATSEPPTSMTEEEFQALFTNADLSKVGPGYKFDLVIGDEEMGGYDINNAFNQVKIPTYDDSNILDANSNGNSFNLFELDDLAINENLNYMRAMKEHNLFGEHKFYVKNGTFSKDNNQTSNANFEDFVVRDGVETLKVMSNSGIDDLSKSGVIEVIDTNNTLADLNARRYSRVTSSANGNVNRLLVNYEDSETDYLSAVGVLSPELQTNYFVNSDVYVLAKSTLNDDDLWTSEKDISMANNSVLVFQDQPNSTLFDKTNILDYDATGLSAAIPSDQFALIQINKSYDSLSNAAESSMFKTSDNNSVGIGVTSNVRLSNMDLNSITADDLRVRLICKKTTDMPTLTSVDGSPVWSWKTNDPTSVSGANTINITSSGTTINISDENGNYLVSSKSTKNWLGTDIYKMMNTSNPSSDKLTLTLNLLTNETSVENRDVLERRAEATLTLGGIINKTVQVDETDLIIKNVSESTDDGVVQSLTGLGLTGVEANYEVKKYVTTKNYFACIRTRMGGYKNLFAVNRVNEKTYWYQLKDTNQNRILPDFYLAQIKNNGEQAFKTSRRFINTAGAEVFKLGFTSDFKVKHLMGFKAGLEYQNSLGWVPFSLESDLNYDNSLDPMFDRKTIINATSNNPTTGAPVFFGTVTIAIDTPLETSLGLASHVDPSSTNPDSVMYRINLSTETGTTSFQAIGYQYSIANDSQFFNKDVAWSPYADGNNLFLKNGSNNAGTSMTLSTIVELNDPTEDTTNVNEVNQVKVKIMSGTTELASFISNKWILENFNIIINRESIIQHNYNVSMTLSIARLSEYLHTVTDTNSNYAKLSFGNNYNGVRVQISKSSVRGESATFALNGDRVHISPLLNAVDSVNGYTGLYSNVIGEEITPSTTGYPLPTNSSVHRNIHPTKFRGYKNGQASIPVFRTTTHIKMVFGNKYQDDMNTYSQSNTGFVWKNRGNEGVYDKLTANDIRTITLNEPVADNLNVLINTEGTSIGALGLKLVPNYSMFPVSVSSVKHIIPIEVMPANYTKTITNPLDTSINEDVSSDIFDVVLHDFVSYDIVSTRIKVYSIEKYQFSYDVPDLKIYHSPQYVDDVRNITNWILIRSYNDTDMRAGQVISDTNYMGVVKFTREQTYVSAFTKWCILPRPIAYLEAYDITSFPGTLPSDLSSITRRKYYVDIDITTSSYGQNLATNLQTHYPFNKNPATSGSNLLNAVNNLYGLNNLQLGFNVDNYLNFKSSQLTFSFTLTSNKLTIYNGVGLSGYTPVNRTTVFDGYISELSTADKWNSELGSTINNNFDLNTKKWNLNTRQLHSVISNFINAPATLSNNYLFVNGIASFGLGTYYLDLYTTDSVVARYYSIDHSYNTTTNKVNVNFYRFSTIQVINWATNDQFSKCENFRPLIGLKHKFTLSVDITNQLSDTPFNIETLIQSQVIQNMPAATIEWTQDTQYVPGPSPVRLCPLSIKGAVALHEILHVNSEHPYKIIGFNRPSIILIKSADGSVVTKITPDGVLSTVKLVTNVVQLEPTYNLPNVTQNDIGIDYFVGNINPTLAP